MAHRTRILAADDDPITRKLIAVNLERRGYEVLLAHDGPTAWAMLQGEGAPEIALLGSKLSEVDGVALCRALRQESGRPRRGIILITAGTEKAEALTAFEAGADDHLAKPINLRDLAERVAAAERALAASRQHALLPTRHGAMEDERLPSEPASPTHASLAGRIVGGKFRVLRPIASGGMGSVWEGVHVTLGTRVAIKFVRPEFARDDDSMARFETEARVMARLHSRYAVQVYDYGCTAGGLPYLVMEYLEGRSLTAVITESGPLPLTEVVHVVAQAAHALERAHRVGIIHRDVKPENIMLVPDQDGDDDTDGDHMVKLVDFGVAKVLLERDPAGGAVADGLTDRSLRSTGRGVIVGTPAFMSPEQLLASGGADQQADLWGLAACAYFAATGELPFAAESLGELVRQVCLNPPPVPSKVNPALPPGFDAWFARACAADPAERFPTGLAFARELQSACGLGRASLVAHDSTPVPVVDPPTSRPQRDDSPRLPRVSLAPAGRRRRAGAQGTVKPPAMQAAAPSTPGRRLTEPAAMRLAFVLALCGFALLLGVRLH